MERKNGTKRKQPAYRNRRRQAAKSRRWKRLLRAALLCAFAGIFLYSAVRLGQYAVRSISQKKLNRELSAVYEADAAAHSARSTPQPEGEAAAVIATPEPTKTAEITPEPTAQTQILKQYQYTDGEIFDYAKELMIRNSDIIGWLYVDGVVNGPVVYRDNEYYLTHDFQCKENSSGTLFLDVDHPLAPETQMLIIHGHSMYDGTMFGLLTHYKHGDYIMSHGVLSWTSLYRQEQYIIIGVVPIDMSDASDDYAFFYGRSRFETDAEFNEYIERMRAQSVRDIKIDVEPSDALLALSTCLDDDRLMVIFRRVREGEDIAQLELQLTF